MRLVSRTSWCLLLGLRFGLATGIAYGGALLTRALHLEGIMRILAMTVVGGLLLAGPFRGPFWSYSQYRKRGQRGEGASP